MKEFIKRLEENTTLSITNDLESNVYELELSDIGGTLYVGGTIPKFKINQMTENDFIDILDQLKDKFDGLLNTDNAEDK